MVCSQRLWTESPRYAHFGIEERNFPDLYCVCLTLTRKTPPGPRKIIVISKMGGLGPSRSQERGISEYKVHILQVDGNLQLNPILIDFCSLEFTCLSLGGQWDLAMVVAAHSQSWGPISHRVLLKGVSAPNCHRLLGVGIDSPGLLWSCWNMRIPHKCRDAGAVLHSTCSFLGAEVGPKAHSYEITRGV